MKKIFLMLLSVSIFASFSVKAENFSDNNEEKTVAMDVMSISSNDLERAKEMEKERIQIQQERIARIKASEMHLNKGDIPTLKEYVIVSDDVETDKKDVHNQKKEPVSTKDVVE